MDMEIKWSLSRIQREFQPLGLNERLGWIATNFPWAVFTTSLGLEDQVITHAIACSEAPIRIVTLQTGRLFDETRELIERTQRHYEIEIKEIHPQADEVADYIDRYGKNGFYDSLKARHACCNIRKIKPLKRTLASADAWITGLRRGQSDNRRNAPFAEWSAEHQLMKFNPMADWSREKMLAAIETAEIPVNPLHARGYPSIGCEPCTRAVKAGEPERAGRWWWENEQRRECGLHVQGAHQ